MKKNLITLGLGVMLSLAVSMVSLAATQTDRWYSENGTWYLRTEDRTGNVVNSWFQDLDGSWYLLADGDGRMMSGLVHDVLTGHYYYLETAHDGFYGRMAYTDGVYVVNSREVYLTFNQEHDGSFGAILSGISELQNTGIETSDIAGIPTESESASTSTDNSVNNNGTSGNSETSDYDGYKSKADQIRNDQALKDAIREANPLDANYSHISLN
jgi:hypothetical protein